MLSKEDPLTNQTCITIIFFILSNVSRESDRRIQAAVLLHRLMGISLKTVYNVKKC